MVDSEPRVLQKKILTLIQLPLPMQISLVTRICTLVLNFVSAALIARLFGAEGTGQIALITAILAVFSVFSLGGFQLMALRDLSGAPSDLKAVFSTYLTRVLIGSFIVGAMFQLILVPLYGSMFKASLGAELIAAISIFGVIGALRIFLNETIRSREKIILYSFLLLLNPISLLLLTVAIPWPTLNFSFAWIVVFAEIAGFVAVCLIFLFKDLGIGLKSVSLTRLRVKSRNYFVSSLSVFAQTQDIFLIGLFVTIEELGVYVIASRIAGLVGLPKVIAAISYAPEVSRVYRESGGTAALLHTRMTTRVIVPLTMFGAIAVSIGAPWILNFLGEEFQSGYHVLLILVTAHLILACTGFSGMLLMMAGHEKFQMLDFFISALIMVLTIVILVNYIGILAGGIGILLGAIFRAFFGTFAVYQNFQSGITVFHVYGSLLSRFRFFSRP